MTTPERNLTRAEYDEQAGLNNQGEPDERQPPEPEPCTDRDADLAADRAERASDRQWGDA